MCFFSILQLINYQLLFNLVVLFLFCVSQRVLLVFMLKSISDLGVNWKDRGSNVWGTKPEPSECSGLYETSSSCSGRRTASTR